MENQTLRLIMNSIENDHCKMLCVLAINEKNPKMRAYYRRKIFIYCVIYDVDYCVSRLYDIHEQNKVSQKDDDIDFAYLYYLSCKNEQNDSLKKKIVSQYEKEKAQEKITSLKDIKYEMKQIEKAEKKNTNIDVKNNCIVSYRATIVNMCMKYTILSNELGLKQNPKIEKIMDENVKRIIKLNKVYA